MGVQAVADALGAALERVEGIERVYVWRPDQIAVPCIVVEFPQRAPLPQTFGRTGGARRWPLLVSVIAGRVDSVQGQRDLAAFLDAGGDASLVGAIEADPTLGGACDAVVFVDEQGGGPGQVGGFGTVEIGTVTYLALQLGLEVWES
jgi:hypothetical protein